MKSVVDRADTRKARWEREVLEPTLKKSPERKGPFTTISGRPIERLYTAEDVAAIDYDREIANPGEFPYVRGIHPTGYRGKLWTMRQFAGFGTPEETNQRYKDLIAAGGTGLSVAFDLPTLDGPRSRSPALARRSGEVRRQHRLAQGHGAAVRRHPARRSEDHDVDDDQLAGVDDLRDVSRRRRAARRRLEEDLGDDSERHPQGIHRAEGIHLPAAPVDAADHRHLRVLREGSAEVEHDLGERLSHPRSGLDVAPGAGVHAARRPRVRAVRRRRRAGRRRLRAAPVVLLQFAQRLLRGDREVPRRAQAVGGGDEKPLRREEPALLAAAVSHADRGRVAHRAAAVQQRRPHRAAGAGGRPRRHQFAAHQLARRSAGAADEGDRDDRAAHAADHRPRIRRHQRRRSAGRLVFHRAADARHGRRHAGVLGHDRSHGRHGRGDRARLPAEGNRRSVVSVPAGGRARREDDRRRQRLRADRREADRDPLHRRLDRRAAAAAPRRAEAHARQRPGPPHARCVEGRRDRAATTRCRCCSTACARMRRWARCATRSARSGASTRKCRSSRPTGQQANGPTGKE